MSIGRITPQMTAEQALADITQTQNRLAVTQQQLASGKRINQPSDDPYGASVAVRLNGELAGLTSYQSTIADGQSWSQTSDSALQSITDAVQRVRELVVQASNGTNSTADLTSIAAEVNQLKASIKQDANTQYDGQYVFSGTATTTPPYASASDTFQGNAASLSRAIAPGVSVPISADLGSVLGSGGGDGKLLDTLTTIGNDLASGNTSGLSTDLSGIDSSLNGLNGVSAAVGSTVDRLQLASTRISSLQTTDQANLSSVQDADMAATMTAFSSEQAAFTAALKASANIVQSSLMDFLK